MSPETPLFGRLTLGSNRVSLGRAGFATLFLRAANELKKQRVGDDTVIQLELSRNRLPDSTTFDKAAIIEHSIAARTLSNDDDESPFPGITVGRVAEAMSDSRYIAYAHVCEPVNRIGAGQLDIENIRFAYQNKFPDCFDHFPKWVD